MNTIIEGRYLVSFIKRTCSWFLRSYRSGLQAQNLADAETFSASKVGPLGPLL